MRAVAPFKKKMHMDYIGRVTIRISGGYANQNSVCATGKMKYHYQG
jgi:hypothetical protein